jgi:dihydrofolate reductase
MPRLTLTTFATLDGVMQAPGGPTEDASGGFTHGGWVFPYADPQFGQFIVEVFARAGAFLLGRGTYQIFAAHWPRVTDPDDPVARALNTLPKHVATRTLATLDWANSSPVRDVAAEVPLLRDRTRGELQVHGSAGLAQTLLEKDLVDELHLLTFPVTLGTGKRLFGSGTTPTEYQLTACRTTETGVVIATYRRKGRPRYGSFALD